MTSPHAVRAVFTALAAVEGIAIADVAIGRATIDHDGRATVDQLRDAIATAGYEVTGAQEERRTLRVVEGGAPGDKGPGIRDTGN